LTFGSGGPTPESTKAAAFASSKVNEHIEGRTIRKIGFIPGKIFNIVAN